jgi:hypothetical protein
MCTRRVLAGSVQQNHLWLARTNAYELGLWSAAGAPIKSVEVLNSPWMTSWTQSTPTQSRTEPPRPVVRAVTEDATRQLWVLGSRAIANWTPPPPAAGVTRPGGRGPVTGGPGAAADPERVRRNVSVVEVLDPGTRRVVATQYFQGRSLRMLSAGLFAEARESSGGVAIWDILQATLVRPVR